VNRLLSGDSRNAIAAKEDDIMPMRTFSADSHMDLTYLPPDTFTSRVPGRWKDQVPQVADSPQGKVWKSGDLVLGRFGWYGPGMTAGMRGKVLVAEGFATGHQMRPANPVLRRQDQERDGVEGEVIYGILGVSCGILGRRGVDDPELMAVIYRAY
jgi:uncharacterized protein